MTHRPHAITPEVLRADAMLTPDGAIADAELEFDETGTILYAGPARSTSRVTRELCGHVLMPGLVNGHTHSAMTLQRGVSDDEGFMPWLAAVQAIEQHLTHDDVAAGLELALLEMIETGTTAFADMYVWDEALIERVREAGMRAMIAPASFTRETVGFPGVTGATGEEVTEATERLAARYADDPQIRIAFGPHAPYTCEPEFLRDIAERSLRTGIPVHTHVSESLAETTDVEARFGATPGAHLDALGIVNDRLLAAHCVHLTAGEITRFGEAGAAVSHNPVSNLKLGNGVAPFLELREAGARLTLGTDSVASNNSLDLFEEIKTATILHRGVRHDAAALRAADVLHVATRGGAEAIGFPASGALTAGANADVIALDVTGTHATPFSGAAALVSHLGFAARGTDVRHVYVGGRHLYADGEHLTLDASAVRARARSAAERVRREAGSL
ncbi:5-methylthioadenosine/S-adenosylhomocysteine deaminase [Leucobacter sp. Psy1]|uniref:amidohydrolase n=1 Tax=Leucobacter sp. Psy1 TaxID=2875729 RepID=UPI001CD6733F|nr:amidohydrolase [Leucobacter sp. Psy1]UBH06699.1 5-methylthioadenosine/S-adenosylhomocysteine deaminase [Leucobacter sp. Psy1]